MKGFTLASDMDKVFIVLRFVLLHSDRVTMFINNKEHFIFIERTILFI